MAADPWKPILEEARRLRADAAAAEGLPAVDIPLETPAEAFGDLAFACFVYAKHARRPPQEIAARLAARISRGRWIASAEPTGGYVNLRVDGAALTAETLRAARDAGAAYGSGDPTGERVLLEHTSVNPTGPIHVGRARNPIIGDALARILQRAGRAVTTEYLVNDVGKQVVLLSWGVTRLKASDVSPPALAKEDHALLPYYVRANALADSDPKVIEEVEELIRRFEGGDADLTREIHGVAERVLRGILATLERIGIRFDRLFWESDLILGGRVTPVLKRLTALPQAQVADGAAYIDMAPYGVTGRDTRWFLTKRDGTSLYPTRDVAYHLDKFSRCDAAINVLGENHRLEFLQLRTALRLLGEREPEAVFYAYVGLPEGTMSTRHGRVVTLDDLVDTAVDRALVEVEKRRPELSAARRREIAETVGVAAVRYNIVRVQAEKPITFQMEEALNFEGNSAPFLMYAHARACGILAKAGDSRPGDPALLGHAQEAKLAKLLARFPSIVQAAADDRRPHAVATFAYDVATQFHQFYRDCPVLAADPPLRAARLDLVRVTRTVLANALDCLGLPAPEEM